MSAAGRETGSNKRMASGLFALLDDVAGIAKLAAAQLDDVAGVTGRVGLKAAGVVVDDTAVTPRYVVGLSPDRELPIIGRIALGSLRNKILILLPAALALSAFAPGAVTPLLMLGGAYLCFEGAEKLAEAVLPHGAEAAANTATVPGDAAALEDRKVSGAVRTDLVLSAEIMAIALADVTDKPLWEQAVVLALVGLAITVGVYGVVGLIVKADDLGIRLARTGFPALRLLGRGLVRGMPVVLGGLSAIGTAAMLWVGGGILVHGLHGFGIDALSHPIETASQVAAATVPLLPEVTAWLVNAALSGVLGLAVGVVLVLAVAAVHRGRAALR